MKRHRQSNKKNTHVQYCLWTVLAISMTRRRWQNRRVGRRNPAVQAPDNTSAIYHLAQDVHNLENRPHMTGRQFQTVTTVL